jgi:FMN phosphatase YigB (HAD superfamily)
VALLLFDLDDTLLGNISNTFVPAYMQALSKRMAPVESDPGKFINILMAAVQQMIVNLEPDQTLQEKFDAVFYPAIGAPREEVEALIDVFYAQDYPQLRGLTQYKPEAVEVVQRVFARGDQAAIATNPLYPRGAILQRLAWAGLPADKNPFALIPSYETFHYTKPNPAFFAELMAQLGWPKTPVVMVGNDLNLDISAAQKLGLAVFWLSNDGNSALAGAEGIPPNGEITDLLSWMDAALLAPPPTNFDSSGALLAVLRSTPAALATLLRQKPENLAKQPTPKEWSPAEVLCHLRDVDAEVNLSRLRKVLSEENPFIPGQDTDKWAEARKYYLQDGWQALADFIQARIQVLGILENLPAEGWNRPARHAIFGPTSIQELVKIIAEHDILHVQQVYKAL